MFEMQNAQVRGIFLDNYSFLYNSVIYVTTNIFASSGEGSVRLHCAWNWIWKEERSYTFTRALTVKSVKRVTKSTISMNQMRRIDVVFFSKSFFL